MLVLTRKINEQIVIGQNITITVLGIEGGQIKLGIEAPTDLNIYRKEVVEAVEESNQQSQSLSSISLEQLKLLIQQKK